MKNKLIKKISHFFYSISDRDIATISIFFPISYSVEFVLSRLQNQDISFKSILAFWVILIAIKFPKLYTLSLLMAAISFIFTGIIETLNTGRFASIGPLSGFGFLILAIIQLIFLEWRKKQTS